MKTLNIDELNAVISYDKETGLLIWKKHKNQSVKEGSIAGFIDTEGYVIVRIKGVALKAHRIAWAITFNKWPDILIDHINGNPSDNRIANLRVASHSQNCQNKRKALPSSKSGLMGAMFDNSTGRYRSRIRVGGKRISLGSFKTPEEAHDAYLKAKRNLHEFCAI